MPDSIHFLPLKFATRKPQRSVHLNHFDLTANNIVWKIISFSYSSEILAFVSEVVGKPLTTLWWKCARICRGQTCCVGGQIHPCSVAGTHPGHKVLIHKKRVMWQWFTVGEHHRFKKRLLEGMFSGLIAFYMCCVRFYAQYYSTKCNCRMKLSLSNSN